ncbi:unnamed protein product, partial [Prorocentrum cordatum]
ILLWPVHRDRRHECWVIETPEGDRYVERKADWRWHVSLLHGWPEGFAGNVVRFRAEVGREALRQMVLEGRDLAREERRRRRLPPELGGHLGEDPTTMVDWHGDERGLDAGVLEAPGDEEVTRPALGDAAPLEGAESALLVAELHAGGGLALGDELAASGTDVSAGTTVIGRRADGRPALRERAPLSDIAAWRAQGFDNARSLAPPPPPPDGAAPAEEGRPRDLRDALRAPVEEVGGASTPREARAEQQPEDVRTLAAEWNEQGVRFKEWRHAVGESSEEAVDGCDLRGAGTALHLSQRFTQHGGDLKTWMSNFCREYGIDQRGRTWHELNFLVTIFWLAGTFDAVNLEGSACLEAAARRIAQITEAHRVAPGQPAAWEAGRFLTGTSDPFDAASPELRSFANRAARGEAERLAAPGRGRTLAAGGREASRSDDVAGALDAGGPPRVGAEGDGGRGGGGRGRGHGRKIKPGDAGATRGGQIYLLPPLRELNADVAGLLGRQDRARVRRLANESLAALNWMHGAERRPPGAPPSWATRCRVAELQHETQRVAQLLAASWGAPASAEDSQQCLARLAGPRRLRPAGPRDVTPFSHARLSAPEDPAGSPRVADLLPEAARTQLKEHESHMMRSLAEVGEIKRTLRSSSTLYGLVLSHERPAHVGLVKRLLKIGLVRLSTTSPPGVDLVSGDGLRRIERSTTSGLGRGEELDDAPGGLDTWLGAGDVKDCFHWLLLDDGPGLREFCGHPPLRAAERGLRQLGGVALERGTLLYPLARALPTSWAWSLHFAQAANAHRMTLLRELDGALPMSDRGPPLLLDSPLALGHYTYEDNIRVLGGSDQVRSALEAATESFGQVWPEVHGTALVNGGGEALGAQLNGREGCTRSTPSRFWHLRGAVQALLRRCKVSGVELEIVAGHLTFLGLVRRESLSCFHCTYRFTQRRYFDRAELWRSVAEELRAFTGLMIFLHADWDARWLPGVHQSDAPLACFGLAYSLWDPRDVGRAASAGGPAIAWGRELRGGTLRRILEGEVDRRCQDPAFEEVPAELLHAGRWRTVLADRWAFEEGILHLEGLALVKAAVRVASSRAGHDGRALLLCDNMAVVLALSRSRARDFKLPTMIQRAAACSFGRGTRFSYTWIPSEFNSSDERGKSFSKEYERDKCVTHLLPCGGWERDRSEQAPDGPDVERAPATSAIHFPEPSWLEKGGASVGTAAACLAASEARLAERHAPAGPGQPSAGADPSAGIGAARGQVGAVCSNLHQRVSAGPMPSPTELEHAPETRWGRAAADLLGSSRAAGEAAAAAEDASESSCEEELPGRASARADDRTYLEAHSVKAATRARYQMHVDELIAFADKRNAPLVEDAGVDDCIAKWMNAEFSEGRRAWRGESMLAAVMFTFPGFSRNGSRKLPRAFRCLRRWRILGPPMSRTPLPWPTWAALALQLVRHGHGLAAIAVLAMVEAYLRPSELLSLTRRSLLPPDAWLNYMFHRLSRGPRDERVSPWDYSQFYQMFVQAAVALGFKMVPYQGRHSGISIDWAQRVRSLDERLKRGRWKATKSVARHGKAGRPNDAWRELTASQKEHALDCERQLEECLARRAASAARRASYAPREWGAKAGPVGDLCRPCAEADLRRAVRQSQ